MEAEARHGDVWGPYGIESGWNVIVQLTDAEMDAILAEYDPSYGATPGVTLCRPVVRMICAAVLAARNNT